MSPWLGLDRLLYSLIKLFLKWITRAKTLPHDLAELGIDTTKPVFYILRDQSIADLAVVEQAAIKLGLPSPHAPFVMADQRIRHAHYAVYRRNLLSSRQRKASNPKRLQQLINLTLTYPGSDVQLVPVSLFWGRRPDRQNSLWKIIFSDNWSPAGLIKKIFIVLTQGRQLYIQFSPVVSLQKLAAETEDKSKLLRKTSRIMRIHFRRQREATIGPDLSHRRMLVNALVQSTPVRAAIERQAQVDHSTLKKTEAKAQKYAKEIASDYSHTVVRFLEIILNWVWHRLFDGVRIYNLDRVRRVARTHEIVYVPCHRSHVDYLLMSFVLYRNGLVPPHIAAGINLNMPVIGSILRRGGAFFIRRSFKDNPLYSAVFSEYIHTILSRGYSVEYFVEGGRSRSGRTLPARTGMIAMTLKSYLRDSSKPIAFVPVYAGYERVIEAASYIGELHGKQKKKESVGGLLGSLGVLRKNWGQVHVNIGEPILLEEFLNQHQPHWKTEEPSHWLRPITHQLGNEITHRINASATVSPINLLSLALLATDKHTIDEQLLTCQLQLYITLLQKAPYSTTVELAETDPLAIIAYALEKDFAFRIEHPQGNLIGLDDATALQLTYIRNNTLHLFALPGLVSSLFLHARSLKVSRTCELVHLLYPFIKSEYSLYWDSDDELNAAVNQLIDVMADEGLLIRHDNTIEGAPLHTLEADQLAHLGKTVLQMQERLFLTVNILVSHGSGKLSSREIQELAQQTAHRFSLLHEFNSPDFFDKTVFKALVSQLVDTGLAYTDDNLKLHFDERLIALDEESAHFLSYEVRLMLRRMARHSGV